MYGFNKIVLSRKGYDFSTGGDYSLFDLNSRKYIVLPIPVDEKEEVPISNPLKYEEVKIKSSYLSGCDAPNLKDLIKQTIKKEPIIEKRIQGRKHNILSWHAHFDPWLGHCPWLEGESNHSIGAFGQVDIAQAHLNTQKVEKGSLFLFFSRFRPFPKARESNCGFSPEQLNSGLYFIYGWLRVGWKPIQKFEDIDNIDILNEKEKEELRRRHPHATEGYFKKYERKEKGKNTIYIADKYLLNDSRGFSGCGYFPKLTDELLLTATGSVQKPYNNYIPSRWELPRFFHEHKLTYFPEERKWKWQSSSGNYLVKAPNRGQEFVFEENKEFCQWLNKLIGEIHKENYRNKW